jgi:ubiquitin C-terminal hydrolase
MSSVVNLKFTEKAAQPHPLASLANLTIGEICKLCITSPMPSIGIPSFPPSFLPSFLSNRTPLIYYYDVSDASNSEDVDSAAAASPQPGGPVCPPGNKQLEDVGRSLQAHSAKTQASASPAFYFLVNSHWWQSWVAFTGGDGPLPSPIDNTSICSLNVSTGPPEVLANLSVAYASVEGVGNGNGSDSAAASANADCYALPLVTWKAVSSWFGAAPPLIYKGSFTLTQNGAGAGAATGRSYRLEINRSISYLPADVEIVSPSASAIPAGASGVLDATGASGAEAEACPAEACFTCGIPSQNRCGRCSKVHYCSSTCQKSHWKYHKLWCAKKPDKPLGRRGNTGLLNIGNSCYLNSSLQCLVHCHPLVSYFLSDRFHPDLNPTNKDGSGKNAQLVGEFEKLSKDMWFDTKSCFSPAAIKTVLGTISRDYMGNLQQDAHDALELILDRLHEDVNRVLVKPYIEQPEGDGSNDAEVGADAWAKHQRRHNSAITDLFGGQLKSNVSCCSKDCSRVSVTFDYFNTLQLAIPGPMSHVMVVYVPYIDGIGGVSDIAKNKQLLRCVLEDLPQGTSASIHTVKHMLVETLDRHHIVLAEKKSQAAAGFPNKATASAPEGQGQGQAVVTAPALAVEDLFMVTWNPRKMAIEDVAGDAEDIRRLTGEGILTLLAFQTNPKLACNAVLLQTRLVTRHNILGNVIEQNRMELVGCPLYLSFDPSWSCARVRYLVWQQVSRFIHPSLIAILNEEPAEVTKRNTLMSSLLRLFMSEADGTELTYNPIVSARHKQHDSCPAWVARHKPLSDLWHTHHTEMAKAKQAAASLRSVGKEIPNASDITIRDFLNVDGIPYLCVRWDKLWNGLLVNAAFDIVALEGSSHGSHEHEAEVDAHKQEVGDSVSLLKCFRLFTKQEVLKGDNAWYCRVCKEHVSAKKELALWSLPKILSVGLKRFAIRGGGEYTNGTMYRSKIDDFVDFPVNGLDLSEFCGSMKTNENGEKKKYIYDLFAVCNHYGRMGFGHYTSCVRGWNNDGSLSENWFKCDDENVIPCSESEVRSRAAYILFYLRRDA